MSTFIQPKMFLLLVLLTATPSIAEVTVVLEKPCKKEEDRKAQQEAHQRAQEAHQRAQEAHQRAQEAAYQRAQEAHQRAQEVYQRAQESETARIDAVGNYIDAAGGYIEAVGNYEVQLRNAELIGEEARSMRLDTNLKRSDALQKQWAAWAKKREEAHQQYRQRMAEGRRMKSERSSTVHREVYRLPRGVVNPASGEISWPHSLQLSKFKTSRSLIAEKFRQLCEYKESSAGHHKEISHAISSWRKELRNEIAMMPREDYMEAQKFLIGLQHEAASIVERS